MLGQDAPALKWTTEGGVTKITVPKAATTGGPAGGVGYAFKITGEPAAMWGKTIVGFGSFKYRGKTSEGEWFPVGFSPRKQNLTLYLHCILEEQSALLDKLGKHKIGKSCLHLNQLDDAHLPTLKKLIKTAVKNPRIAGAETVG